MCTPHPLTPIGARSMSDLCLHQEGNLWKGRYISSEDIQALERRVPGKALSMSLLKTIVSPLSDALGAWAMWNPGVALKATPGFPHWF